MADGVALNAVLTANFKRLETDLKKAGLVAEKAVDDIEQKFAKSRPSINLQAGLAGGLAGGLVGGITSQLGDLLNRLAEANKAMVELGDVANRTGASTAAIQQAQYSGSLQGISSADTLKAYDAIGRAIDKAKQGETEFGKLLAANKVEVTDTATVFARLADLVQNAKSEYQKEQILELAGVSKELIPLFEQGAAALAKQGEEAARVGAIISDETIAKAKEFEDKWNAVVTNFGILFKSTLGEVAVAIETIIHYADQLAQKLSPVLSILDAISKSPLLNGLQPGTMLNDLEKLAKVAGLEDKPAPEARPLTIRPASRKTTVLPSKPASGGGGGTSEEDQRFNQVQRYIEQLEKTGRILQAEKDSIGLTNAERAKAIELARIGTVTDAGQLEALNKQIDANERLRQAVEKAKMAQKGMNDAAQFAGQELLGAFESLLDGGKIEDAINGITKALMKAALQAAILGQGPLANLFGSASTTGGPGGLIGSLLGAFGGARASGGPVQAGKTYLVGENGPEMVRFGKNGSVMPNGVMGGRGGGGGGVNVQVINQSQAQVGQPEVSTGPDGRMMLRMLIREEVTGDVAKNGPIAQMFQGRYGMNRSGGRR